MKLFKDAIIYDGTGSEAFKGDILVEGDRILKVEDFIQPEDGWKIIDLKGLSVSPGFIERSSKIFRTIHTSRYHFVCDR